MKINVNNINSLEGQPVDLGRFAWVWRADREEQEAPEACFLLKRKPICHRCLLSDLHHA